MDWIQAITIIGVLGGFMIYMLQRVEKDISTLASRMDGFERRMDGHATRIDQLYKIIVDMLKERK